MVLKWKSGFFRGKRNGEGRNRTADAGIFSPSLYRLSYLAIRLKNAENWKSSINFPLAKVKQNYELQTVSGEH
jgi:hypothetical protein